MRPIKLFIALCFATVLFSCNQNSDSIKLGAVIPLTGKLSQMGEVEKNGMKLAIDDLKKEGINLQLITEDSKSNPKDGVTAARKLIDIDQCNLILTSTTGTSAAVEPITTEKKLNLIAYCMDPDIASKSDYVTRLYEGVESEAEAIKEYLKTDTSSKRIGLFYNRVEVWDKVNKNTLKPFIEANGKEVVFMEDFAVGEKDFKNLVLKMKDCKLDHLILLGYGFEFPQLFAEMQKQVLLDKITVIGGWGFLYSKVSKEDLEECEKNPAKSFEILMKISSRDPTMIQKALQKISKRLQEKIQKGQIRPQELAAEAEELMKEFQTNPAFVEIMETFRSAFNVEDPDLARATGNEGSARLSLIKERLKKKLEARNKKGKSKDNLQK